MHSVNRVDCNLGFDGRQFLTEEEWRTYLRRKPVRYISKGKPDVCQLCGKLGTSDNPLQNAHRIGFDFGILNLALTPEYLDGDRNIVAAHRKTCNKSVEVDAEAAMQVLRNEGVRQIPSFLPEWVHATWRRTIAVK